MTAYVKYKNNKRDQDDDMSLADIISLKISAAEEEKNQFLYHRQLQSSYYQLQYLQQQQMMSMMMYHGSVSSNSSISSSRRSSTVSSINSSNSRYFQYMPSPSSSTSSIKRYSTSAPTSNPKSISMDAPKRRQSLSKRIKKVFGMNTVDLPENNNKRHHQLLPPSPCASTISTTSSSNNKKSLSFNTVIKLHETFSPSEYDRTCDSSATCQKLTPVLALKIKEELNQYKLNEMSVHPNAKNNTHFFI